MSESFEKAPTRLLFNFRPKIQSPKIQLIHKKTLHKKFQKWLYQIFKTPFTTKFSTYLGLPSFVGRKTKEVFKHFIDKFLLKLATWKAQSINKIGRLIFIDSILSALTNHIMAWMILSVGVVHGLKKIRRKFL